LKPSIPKGTRDFLPKQVNKRNYIFRTIEGVFKLYGYVPIETPSFENIDTLTGKYGDEGDQLIFKILNSGDYLAGVDREELAEISSGKLADSIAGKALRYDLTVPFARYVVQHQNDLTFPFKRYQIQPVWRADRPQKGRYREFYQCDVDVIGSDSLHNEVELIQIIDQVFSELGVSDFKIGINHRKILAGLAEGLSIESNFNDLVTAIDKWDKIGEEGVTKELSSKGLGGEAITAVMKYAKSSSLSHIGDILQNTKGERGMEEVNMILTELENLGVSSCAFNASLARGLSYYTGTIIEVIADGFSGSICAGGRYDDLTGIFGMKDISGVGVSFGADRIYDLMEERQLFPSDTNVSTELMFANFGAEEASFCLSLLKEVRVAGIVAELYPDAAKMKKQFSYADAKHIPYVALVGADEMAKNELTLKNMASGEQRTINSSDLVKELKR